MTEEEIRRFLAAGPPDSDSYEPVLFETAILTRGSGRSPRRRASSASVGGLMVFAAALGAVALLVGQTSGPLTSADPTGRLPVGAASTARPSSASVSSALPVDPSIKAVSLSGATEEERRVLDLCTGFGLRVEDVAGMGEVARGMDVPKYVRLSGREPDLNTDLPVWVVAFAADHEVPRQEGRVVKNPICVVVGGAPAMFVPFGDGGSGAVIPDLPKQEFSLPPLKP